MRLVTLLLVASATTAHAVEVRGRNRPDRDVRALQTAFDAGGHVTLTGTFDLGHQTVFITRDAVIEAGAGGATVRNGGDIDALYGDNAYSAFYVGWDGRMLDRKPAHGAYGALSHPHYFGGAV